MKRKWMGSESPFEGVFRKDGELISNRAIYVELRPVLSAPKGLNTLPE